MIQNVAQTNDSVSTDSIAKVAKPLLIKATYPHGFPDSLSIGNEQGNIATLSVIEPPKPQNSDQYIDTPIKSGGLMLIVLLSIAMVAITYRKGYKYLYSLGRKLFEIRSRNNIYDALTINESQTIFSLVVNSCIMQGILVYFILGVLMPEIISISRVIIYAIICIGMVSAYNLFQYIAYSVIGNVFSTSQSTKMWKDGYKAMESLLGLLLIPIVLIMIVYPESSEISLFCGVIIFIILRIIFICKGFRIFFNNFSSTPFFILYLCAIEIVPIILSLLGTIILCSIAK